MKIATIIQGLVLVQIVLMAKYGSSDFLAIAIDLSILEIAILQALKMHPKDRKENVLPKWYFVNKGI